MGRPKGKKNSAGTRKTPHDVDSYIKKVKIPILLDIFCSTIEGDLIRDLAKFARPFFVDIFKECKTIEEAETISEKTINTLYEEENIDRFFKNWYANNSKKNIRIVFGDQINMFEYMDMLNNEEE